jgi:predicted metal-dependent enzyme (double-stranded beta helix superfamily)
MEENNHVEHDEFAVDSPLVRAFVDEVRFAMEQEPDPSRLVERLKPTFAALLEADGWLPAAFAQPFAASGMGGGIGQYLLFRAAHRDLTLFSLVVPPGSSTPVHDHLAWGLVGLYRGQQHEQVYDLAGGDLQTGTAELRLSEERTLDAGEFYALLPPHGDIHRVTTTSREPSISIHVLGNDAGCVLRHRFDPEVSKVTAFRSGYSNQPCKEASPI